MTTIRCDKCFGTGTVEVYTDADAEAQADYDASLTPWAWVLVHVLEGNLLCPHCGSEPFNGDGDHTEDCPTCGTCAQTNTGLSKPWHRDETYEPTRLDDEAWSDYWQRCHQAERDHIAAFHT